MAIPGLKKPDHIGFTVPNLAEAIAFFRDHFDFELAYEFGPFVASDNWMAEHLNVNARAEITRIAVMNAKG
ncbi:MAG: VOC family protein, partial [Aeromonas veronii]